MTSLHFCRAQLQSSHLPLSSPPWICTCGTLWRERLSGMRHSKVSPVSCQPAPSLPELLLRLWWLRELKADPTHINSVHVMPGLSHTSDSASKPSLRVTSGALFQTTPSMEGVSKGSWETDVLLMQTQILLMSSVELSQFHQQTKFPSFPRCKMVACSPAHPCPAWALSLAPRNAPCIFRKGWWRPKGGDEGTELSTREVLLVHHLGGCWVSSWEAQFGRVWGAELVSFCMARMCCIRQL